MAEPQMVDPHDVVMTGENSFIRLSNDGGKTLTDRISHWRVLWSPAGQGHALFIESGLLGKGPTLYADNAGVARYLQRTIAPALQGIRRRVAGRHRRRVHAQRQLAQHRRGTHRLQ